MSNKHRKTPEACVTMGWCECAPGIYEIDEFDCASCFLVVGEDSFHEVGIGYVLVFNHSRFTNSALIPSSPPP